jgi:hypothetical protein
MSAVHHLDPGDTIRQLERVLGPNPEAHASSAPPPTPHRAT